MHSLSRCYCDWFSSILDYFLFFIVVIEYISDDRTKEQGDQIITKLSNKIQFSSKKQGQIIYKTGKISLTSRVAALFIAIPLLFVRLIWILTFGVIVLFFNVAVRVFGGIARNARIVHGFYLIIGSAIFILSKTVCGASSAAISFIDHLSFR